MEKFDDMCIRLDIIPEQMDNDWQNSIALSMLCMYICYNHIQRWLKHELHTP